MKTVPVLHTKRCVLTAITEKDIPVLRQIMEDIETRRFLPELCDVVKTEAGWKQCISSFDTYHTRNEGILWGIRLEENLIGFIAIMDIPENPTLFYAMHPDYRNRGLMKECLEEVIKRVQKEALCDKLQTEVYFENKASLSLLIDNGFVPKDRTEQKQMLNIVIK